MIKNTSIVARTKDQVSCDLAGEAVILGLNKSEYYGLNDVGTIIWNLIQEPKKVSEVVELILNEYDAENEKCEKDIISLLNEMEKNNLLEVVNETIA